MQAIPHPPLGPPSVPPLASPQAFNSLNLSDGLGDYTYLSPAFSASSPARPYIPPHGAAISPPSLTCPLSAGELFSDGMASGRHSCGSGSHSPPAPIPYPVTVPRSHRFNLIVTPTTRASVRGMADNLGLSKNILFGFYRFMCRKYRCTKTHRCSANLIYIYNHQLGLNNERGVLECAAMRCRKFRS